MNKNQPCSEKGFSHNNFHPNCIMNPILITFDENFKT